MDIFDYEKDLFELVLENINEEVYLVNDKYEIIYVNNNAYNNLFNGQEVINKSIFDMFPSINMENSTIVRAFRTKEPTIKAKATFISNNGKRKEYITSTLPLIIDGKLKYVCEISEDITGLSNMSEKIISEMIKENKSSTPNRSIKSKKDFYNLDSIIGESKEIKTLKDQIIIYSKSPSNLMIYGETGTGKEMVAQSIFSLSHDVKKAPFIAQNCAAIPEALLESILFGTVKGAFTGAETRPGLFELASGGVLFLDEINSMPKILQAKYNIKNYFWVDTSIFWENRIFG
ncbi:MAG: sigma 54-interacting transcriptional regulator [Tissierellia bacterium]|nr:sigma 54-interacting transcriptional regulator [Tissierellia bacterium]MDD4780862.1 sigma 54-interacting transcriptional regulator [Tissierellia bacterium]